MQNLKHIFYAFFMFLLGLAFCGLIFWEIKFGTAGGSYGAFNINSALGGFLWIIVFQLRYIFLIFYEVVIASRTAFTKNIKAINNTASSDKALKSGAAAILIKAVYGMVWGSLSIWVLVELFYLSYPIMAPLVLDTGKNIFERLFLPAMMIMCIGVIIYLMVTLFFLDLFKDVLPKVPASYRLLFGKR